MGLSKMMLRSNNRAPDRETLLSTKQANRSEFTSKPASNIKLVKRLTAAFRPLNDKHRALKPEGDEATPPSSPSGADEPLTVSMLTSPYPHPLEEDNSLSGTTISDLSASIKRPYALASGLYSAPVPEEEEDALLSSESAKSSATNSAAAAGTVCNSSCGSDGVLSKMLGLVDRTCGSVTTTHYTKGNENPPIGPAWGTAPSYGDGDDDTVSPLVPSTPAPEEPAAVPLESTTLAEEAPPVEAEAETETGHTEVAQESKEPPEVFAQDDTEDSTAGAHETFELVLDPSVLKKSSKRSLLKWKRIKEVIIREHQREKAKDAVASIASVRAEVSAPADRKKSSDIDRREKPTVVRPAESARPHVLQKIASRTRSKGAKELAASLMEDGELVGEEYLEEYEDSTLLSGCTPDSLLDSASQMQSTRERSAEKNVTMTKNVAVTENALKPIDISNRTTSWSEFTKALATLQAGNGQVVGAGPIKKSTSSPIRLLSDNSTPVKAAPPSIWRSAVDPTSGRLYYYHRITRKSTWSKPDNFDASAQQGNAQKLGTSVRSVSGKVDEFANRSRSAVPLNILAVAGPSIVKPKPVDDSDIPLGSDGQPLLKKTNPRDFQSDIWEKKKEITRLLTKMAPPDDASVVKLMAQYEGKEDDLLAQLGELVASRPFDEPGELPADDSVNVSADLSEKSLNSINLRTRTANTTTTSRTEKTDRIKNTTKDRSPFESIKEKADEVLSDLADGSLSSQSSAQELPKEPRSQPSVRTQRAIAAKQRNSGRTRDLHVEEFSTKRWGLATVNYEGKATPKPKVPRPRAKNPVDTKEPETYAPPNNHSYVESSDGESNYMGDNDETDVETFTDTVSALSVPDPDFSGRMEEFERARRRALDDAIRRKDWDLAASVTDNIRNRSMDSSDIGVAHSEWTQSELDQFISENDWDAVASYIAQMRDGKSKPMPKEPTTSLLSASGRQVENSVSFDANIQKRFGARSQLQRVLTEEEQSCSSWESESFYESDSESRSSTSDGYGKAMIRKEFSC